MLKVLVGVLLLSLIFIYAHSILASSHIVMTSMYTGHDSILSTRSLECIESKMALQARQLFAKDYR